MLNDDHLELERNMENVYKIICEFEKPHYEKIVEKKDGSITIAIDPNELINIDNLEINYSYDPVNYPSYRNAFNRRYRNNFKRNLNSINIRLLEKELGKETLKVVIERDQELKKHYFKTKEIDLDNDGVPDRINKKRINDLER